MSTNFKPYLGTGEQHDYVSPPMPPWRARTDASGADANLRRGATFRPDADMIEMVNAALLLRRPLLVKGKPGTGKSSLIYAVARELRLGPVLRWPVTSRSTLARALYEYDAIGRMQEANLTKQTPDIGDFVQLGPLGTALLPSNTPRALLIDEIDKADIDLPNDLLDVFEEGEFVIPELARLKTAQPVTVRAYDGGAYPVEGGKVACREFPFVILTSNGERDFAPAFMRRCLQLEVKEPNETVLGEIVEAQLQIASEPAKTLISRFIESRKTDLLATDQLLNAVFTVMHCEGSESDLKRIKATVMQRLGSS